MRPLKAMLLCLAVPFVLAACSESADVVAAREQKVMDAIVFAEDRPENVGVAVFGNNIVVNFPERDINFGNLVREIGIEASGAAPEKMFTIYVIDGETVATSVPEETVCSVSASDNRIQGNNC